MKTVLIFDPDPVSREGTVKSFQRQGYRPTTCFEYDVAIEHAKTETYTSVAFHMHDTEEVQLAMRLREMQPDAMMFVQGNSDVLAVNMDLLISIDTIPLTYRRPKSAR